MATSKNDLRCMMVPENAALRKLALKVLAHRAGPDPGAEAFAAASHRTYDDLARVSAQLIGQAGVDALTGRALHLAQQEYPWLVRRGEGKQPQGSLEPVIVCLKSQDPTLAFEAAGAVFAILTGLLITFIGQPLTTQLLRNAWPDAFSDAGIEET